MTVSIIKEDHPEFKLRPNPYAPPTLSDLSLWHGNEIKRIEAGMTKKIDLFVRV